MEQQTVELVFWSAVALLVYVYAGYPFLVRLCAALRPRIVLRRAQEPSVTLVVAAGDAAAWIDDKLDDCLTLDYPHNQLQVVLVCNGSADETLARARAFRSPRVDIVEFRERRSRAACLNEAVRHARGDIILFSSVRQKFDRAALQNIVMNFVDETVGAVICDAIPDPDTRRGFSIRTDLHARLERWLRVHESRFSSAVGAGGAPYAIRRDCFRPMPEETVLDEVLVPMNVVLNRKRVVFDRHAVAYDSPSVSRFRERHHGIRLMAGNCQLVLLAPSLLSPFRNRVFVQFISHRLLRVVAPFLHAIALVTSFMLAMEAPGYRYAVIIQLVMYIIALFGILLPTAQRLNIIRVHTAFLLQNWFALLGLFRFARYRRSLPW
ncbi:MAG: glycosyltransferase [Proteobacteria bacterium]|nr:glycosyltransferase [Pseudomonadota bacterium]